MSPGSPALSLLRLLLLLHLIKHLVLPVITLLLPLLADAALQEVPLPLLGLLPSSMANPSVRTLISSRSCKNVLK